jgi:DNA (cytosine-5)-methyltransferase 1
MARKNLWPTPTEQGNYNRKGLSKTSGDGLATAVKKYGTPQARDWKGKPGKNTNLGSLCHQITGKLNPTWVEWLMGYPLGWTELKDLETQWFGSARGKLSSD